MISRVAPISASASFRIFEEVRNYRHEHTRGQILIQRRICSKRLGGLKHFSLQESGNHDYLESGRSERTARNTSNPSRSGMLKSRIIKSNLVFSTAVKASLPELLSTTEYPAPSSILLNNLRSSGLSSTTKIDWSIVSAIFHPHIHRVISVFFQISRGSASPSGQGEGTENPPV